MFQFFHHRHEGSGLATNANIYPKNEKMIDVCFFLKFEDQENKSIEKVLWFEYHGGITHVLHIHIITWLTMSVKILSSITMF